MAACDCFLAQDAARVDRVYREAVAENDALRQLVGDFVDDAIPVLRKMAPSAWSPEDWRARAVRVLAGCRLTQGAPS